MSTSEKKNSRTKRIEWLDKLDAIAFAIVLFGCFFAFYFRHFVVVGIVVVVVAALEKRSTLTFHFGEINFNKQTVLANYQYMLLPFQ